MQKRRAVIQGRVLNALKLLLLKAPPLKRLLYGLAGYLLYHKEFRRSLTNRNIYLIGTPEHGNLGDHAIAYATEEYLHKILPEYHLAEISEEMFFKYTYCIKRYCNRSDLFILSGGGNIGNEYRTPELIRRCVIQSFPKNKIVIFPQTIYFTKDREGWNEWSKSLKLYRRHKNLTIITREHYSYEHFRQFLPDRQILLTPDMVFSLERSDPGTSRRGAIVCFRKDRESVLKEKDRQVILKSLGKYFNELTYLDTASERKVGRIERTPLLEEFWSEFRKVRLVVTDRLHGMIFAAITGTPCIVFSNYNDKIRGSYRWIKHLQYIRYLEEADRLDEVIEQLCGLSGGIKYDSEFAEPYFEKLKQAVLQ